MEDHRLYAAQQQQAQFGTAVGSTGQDYGRSDLSQMYGSGASSSAASSSDMQSSYGQAAAAAQQSQQMYMMQMMGHQGMLSMGGSGSVAGSTPAQATTSTMQAASMPGGAAAGIISSGAGSTAGDEEEQPLYVNAKQYHRILKRRAQRAKLEAENKLPKSRMRGRGKDADGKQKRIASNEIRQLAPLAPNIPPSANPYAQSARMYGGGIASYSPLLQQQQQQQQQQQHARMTQSQQARVAQQQAQVQQQQQQHAQSVPQHSSGHAQQGSQMGYGTQDMFSGFGVNGGSTSQFPYATSSANFMAMMGGQSTHGSS